MGMNPLVFETHLFMCPKQEPLLFGAEFPSTAFSKLKPESVIIHKRPAQSIRMNLGIVSENFSDSSRKQLLQIPSNN